MCSSFLFSLDSVGKRIGGGILVSGGALAVFVVACNVLHLPLGGPGALMGDCRSSYAGGSGSGGTSSTGVTIQQFAQFRAMATEKKPGFFTEADFRAAEAAVLSSPNRDVMAMAMLYANTLKSRYCSQQGRAELGSRKWEVRSGRCEVGGAKCEVGGAFMRAKGP